MDQPAKNDMVIDLGTSVLAGRLLSCAGETLAEACVPNPQGQLGADIITRMQLAHQGGSDKLQELVVQGLEELTAELVASAQCRADDVGAVAVAGNPGMSCLLLGHSVETLLFPPHRPSYTSPLTVPVAVIDLGLPVPFQLLPPISGYVGGDLVAGLLGLEGDSPRAGAVPATLLIDVGTNAEIALWDGARWWVTSAAAGPAFEGGNISSGMTMQDGAVHSVTLLDDRLQLKVRGGGPPVGICGSGLAGLIAAALAGGLVDPRGRIVAAQEVETNLSRYLVKHNGGWAIRYHRSAAAELLLTQQDIRNFQLAKGAVRAGVQLLLERGAMKADDLCAIVLTGALGTSLPVEVLKRVALLPEPMLDRTSFVENGVLTGLQYYLQNAEGAQRLKLLLQQAQPFPLSGTPAFEKLFLTSLEF